MLNEELPENLNLDGEARLSIRSDLTAEGVFGTEWLVVTQDRLQVFAEDGDSFTRRIDLDLSELKNPEAETFTGAGSLKASLNGSCMELMRFSTARAGRFIAAAKALGKWLGNEEFVPPPDRENRCPNCDLPLEPGSKICPACLPKRQALMRLVRYLKPHWGKSCLITFLAVCITALTLVMPYMQKPLMDRVLAPQNPAATLERRLQILVILVLLLLAVRILSWGLGLLKAWLTSWLGNRISHDIRSHLYSHLQYLSLRFFDKRQMGTVISRVNQDVGQLQFFLIMGSQELLANILLLVGSILFMFGLSWKLALLVLIPTPFVVGCISFFWKKIRFVVRRFFHRWSRLNSLLNESLHGLKVVKAFAQEQKEVDRFTDRSDELAQTGTHAAWMGQSFFASMGLIVILAMTFVYYLGGRDVVFGELSLGSFTAFLMFMTMFIGPINSMTRLIDSLNRSLTASERVFEILDSQPEIQEAEDALPIPQVQGAIEFKDVSFGYESTRPALKHVSVKIEPGEMIGLVGHSGAGKSTSINLLCRFYDPDEGEILIDGKPLTKLRFSDIRSQVGLVPQETFLFSGTIAENIGYSKPGATKEDILKAAKVANAHGFIMMKPDGYETLVGEGGAGLSAGERQRISIARAVLHDPKILILDEATSHVDVETEKEIQEAIDRLVEGRTTVAIAHRLSTLKNADRLIVLKQGEVAEMGSHDELIALDGEFHRLVKTYQEISKVQAVER